MIANPKKKLKQPNPDALNRTIRTVIHEEESESADEVEEIDIGADPKSVMSERARPAASVPIFQDPEKKSAESDDGSSSDDGAAENSSSSEEEDDDDGTGGGDAALMDRLTGKRPVEADIREAGSADSRRKHGRKSKNRSRERPMRERKSDEEDGPPSPEKLRVLKLEMLSKLKDLERMGVTLSQEYNIDSDYDVMKREYDIHFSIRNKHVTVTMYEQVFFTTLTLCEYINEEYNPFNFRIKGFSSQVKDEIDIYRDIFGEFHELYHSKSGKVHPMLRLGLAMSNTMIGYHIKNSTKESEEAKEKKMMEMLDKRFAEHMRTLGLGVYAQQQAPQQAAPKNGPSYDDLVRYNTELQGKMDAMMTRMNKFMGDDERRSQIFNDQLRGQPATHTSQQSSATTSAADQMARRAEYLRQQQARQQHMQNPAQGQQRPIQTTHAASRPQSHAPPSAEQIRLARYKELAGGAAPPRNQMQERQRDKLSDFQEKLRLQDEEHRHRVMLREQQLRMQRAQGVAPRRHAPPSSSARDNVDFQDEEESAESQRSSRSTRSSESGRSRRSNRSSSSSEDDDEESASPVAALRGKKKPAAKRPVPVPKKRVVRKTAAKKSSSDDDESSQRTSTARSKASKTGKRRVLKIDTEHD
jgi:hypothetical protein